MRRAHLGQTAETEGREEDGTRDRHSSKRSSGREETVVVAVAAHWSPRMWGWGWGWVWVWVWEWAKDLVSCGLGKQDFMSHEKWRELQLSDI